MKFMHTNRLNPLALMLYLAAGVAATTTNAANSTTPHGTMMRYPDVSKTHIVFSYANDLWMVPKAGGAALPLSSPRGQESFPRFSADGKSIAFVGNYDGNRDIYTIAAEGGPAERVTYHSAGESLSDWAGPNFEGGDRLVYLTNGFAGLARQTQLFSIPAEGGQGKILPVPYAGFGMISPSGEWLAYTPHSTDNRTWKRYRGGMATDIWLFNLKDKTSRKLTDWEGNDTLPMWVPGGDGSVLYYLSDQGPEHRMNIWSCIINGGKREQVTKYKNDDIKWPSVGPGDSGEGEIVFQLGGELRLFNLATRSDTVVKVTIPGDRPALRKRPVDAAKFIESASISPTGKRVAIEARGDLYSAPAKEGVVRSLTRSDGIFERSPSWSPNGRWIAYLSDETGEFELWVRPADLKAPEDKKSDDKKAGDKKGAEEPKGDDKPDDKPSDKPGDKPSDKPGEKPTDKPDDEEKHTEKHDGDKGEGKDGDKDAKKDAAPVKTAKEEVATHSKLKPRKLTTLGAGYKSSIVWSPDSKMLVLGDQYGQLYLVTVESGAIKPIDKDPWGNPNSASWSQDSNWLTFSSSQDDPIANNRVIYLYNVKSAVKTQVTSPMFSSSTPRFDRKGDWLYFASNRIISDPTYSDLDSTFAYNKSEALYAVPLRADVKNPWAPKSDEEEWKSDEKKKDDKKEDKKDKKEDGEKEDKEKKPSDEKPEDGKPERPGDEKPKENKPSEVAVPDDGVSGTWTGTAAGNAEGMPPGGMPITFILILGADGALSGSVQSIMGGGAIGNGKHDKASGDFSFSMVVGRAAIEMKGTIKGEEATGTWTVGANAGSFSVKRTSRGKADGDAAGDSKSADGKSDSDAPAKEVKIELEGFERRAIPLPISAGGFGQLAVNSDNKLLFVRASSRNEKDATGIKIFDLNDEKKEEGVVSAGAMGFELSADGKKILIVRGDAVSVVEASAGGKSTSVPTNGMTVSIDPRAEWKQIVNDTWRQFRDYFYEAGMHNVDWPAVKEHYLAMVDDAATREDVAFIQAELVSELNIGHAYITSMGDTEEGTPSVNVGMLGCDYELTKSDAGTAYKIVKIHGGADWDTDARGPLAKLGVDVKEGEYLLAVNGREIDISKEVYAAFLGTADKVTSITVGTNPTLDDKAREVLVTPIGGEGGLRYRGWIESKREYVAKKSGGKVGYIYVPNTGVDGQSDLWRQFIGQRGTAALIIDDRWNGGGQIPTRFIEMLNRKPINFWARRNGNDWAWPPDGHFGPKAMIINGLAGSGGDMFPWLFKHEKVGKVFGTRTWGGLVGISGYPALIDGGRVAVPSFGFYELDGTWGVEGHGVDPDVEVIDDPAKMVDGTDPQLDAAITHLLDEVKRNPFTPPTRPANPDRKGMGIDPRDR